MQVFINLFILGLHPTEVYINIDIMRSMICRYTDYEWYSFFKYYYFVPFCRNVNVPVGVSGSRVHSIPGRHQVALILATLCQVVHADLSSYKYLWKISLNIFISIYTMQQLFKMFKNWNQTSLFWPHEQTLPLWSILWTSELL